MSKNQKDNLLNLEEIEKLAKQYEDSEIYTLKTVNQDIKFNPYFSRTKIREVMEEFQKYTQSEDEADKIAEYLLQLKPSDVTAESKEK